MTDPELTRPKAKARLSESLDRAELLAAGVCVACRTSPALKNCPHCHTCYMRLNRADVRAFTGFFAELRRLP